MLKRHAVVLSLLKAFGRKLSRKQLQKLVFLFCEEFSPGPYEFVPHKYGCYSLALARDQDVLIGNGYLKATEDWQLIQQSNLHFPELELGESEFIKRLSKRFASSSETDLIKYVYEAHPFYAIHSVIAKDVLDEKSYKALAKIRNNVAGKGLYSIGYEGLSLDGYLLKLVRYDVKLVCDVRKNPISRKFGFSKTILSEKLNEMGIEYLHYPQLGIPSEYRQSLCSQKDYDDLFEMYERSILPENLDYVHEISRLIDEKERVALLCFEKEPCECHRTRVVNKILEFREKDIRVVTR